MKFLKRAAAVGAASLVAGALVTVPASAASGTLNYTCPVYDGLAQVPVTVVVDTEAPDTLAPGASSGPINGSATVTVSGSWADILRGMADSMEGTATVETSLNGAAPVATAMTITPLTVPATGDIVLEATGQLAPVTAGAAGTSNVFAAGNFNADVTLKKAGAADSAIALPCTLDAGQDSTIDTIKSVAAKAATKTNVKAKYAKKKKQVKANITVKAGKKAAKGKVNVVLKKGKKTVAKRTVKLNKLGKKVVTFKKIRAKGQYRVIANYKGNKKFEKSRGVAKVRVR